MLAFRNDRFSPSGTDGSNPLSSRGESSANLTPTRDLRCGRSGRPAGSRTRPKRVCGPVTLGHRLLRLDAQRTALTTLANSTTRPSPVVLTDAAAVLGDFRIDEVAAHRFEAF